MIYRKSRSKISIAKENFSDHAGCLSLFWILTPKENEIIYDMVQNHCISSVAFNPVSSISCVINQLDSNYNESNVVEEPPKSSLAIKRQVSGSEYLEMSKTK